MLFNTIKENVSLAGVVGLAGGTGTVLAALAKGGFELVGKIVDEVFKENSFYSEHRPVFVCVCMVLAVAVISFVIASTWTQVFGGNRARIRLEADLDAERRVGQQLQARNKELQDERDALTATIREQEDRITQLIREKDAESEARAEAEAKYEEEHKYRLERLYQDMMTGSMNSPLHNKVSIQSARHGFLCCD